MAGGDGEDPEKILTLACSKNPGELEDEGLVLIGRVLVPFREVVLER